MGPMKRFLFKDDDAVVDLTGVHFDGYRVGRQVGSAKPTMTQPAPAPAATPDQTGSPTVAMSPNPAGMLQQSTHIAWRDRRRGPTQFESAGWRFRSWRQNRRHRRHLKQRVAESERLTNRTDPPPRWGRANTYAGRPPYRLGRAGSRDMIFTGTTNQTCGLFPFVIGAGSPQIGVPLGVHALTGEPVHWSPLEWLAARLVTNPTAFIVAQPGVGKSALIKRVLAISAGCGVLPIVLGDLKPDYPPLVRELGGQVLTLGPGRDKLNPLDAGPIAAAAERMRAGGRDHEADVLWQEANERRLALVLGVCGLGRGGPLNEQETVILAAALDEMHRNGDVSPTLGDLVAYLREPSERLLAECYIENTVEFTAAARPLIHTLMIMLKGPLRGVFDGPTTTPLDLTAAAIELDISNIDGDLARPAAMLAVWAYALGVIESEIALADVGLAPERNYLAVLDEFWQALRGAPGLVDRADRITRINRQLRLGVLLSTHSLDDLKALPTTEDQAKAKGIIDRSATVIIGASAPAELDALVDHIPGGLNDRERALVASWSSSAHYDVEDRHPGQGMFLIKTGEQRKGLPVQILLTEDERRLYETTHLAGDNTNGPNQ